MSSSKRKSEFLGMPFGTATARLKKMILFSLLQKFQIDSCYVCNEKIDRIQDLTIEHILPWEGRDVSLFWDLNNIAFSHIRCNIPHVRPIPKNRKEGPVGTSWCKSCQQFLANDQFTCNTSRWNGKSPTCKTCVKKNDTRINHKRILNATDSP